MQLPIIENKPEIFDCFSKLLAMYRLYLPSRIMDKSLSKWKKDLAVHKDEQNNNRTTTTSFIIRRLLYVIINTKRNNKSLYIVSANVHKKT